MDERWHGNLFQVSEATDEKDVDLVIAVLCEWMDIDKEEGDRSDELSNKLIDFTSVTMNGLNHHTTISKEEYLNNCVKKKFCLNTCNVLIVICNQTFITITESCQ